MSEQTKAKPTKEELLKPRVEVKADFPGSPHDIGDVLPDNPFMNYKDYPVIFESIAWWEKRDIEEMPDFVNRDGIIVKVKKHFSLGDGNWRNDRVYVFCIERHVDFIADNFTYSGFEPATEAEYNEYLKSIS